MFPWGLLSTTERVLKQWFEKYPIDTVSTQLKLPDNTSPSFNSSLRPYQVDAIRGLLESHGGILCIPTGGGKTFTCIEALRIWDRPSLIVVHTVELRKQWQRQVPDFVEVVTYQGVKDFDAMKKYGVIVFDECHHVAAKTLFNFSMKLTDQIIVGLSATPKREDGEEMKMHGALGNIVYKISLRDLIDQNYLCDAKVKWITLDKHEPSQIGMTYQETYREYVVENGERNKKIVEEVVCYKDKKILILVNQIDHGDELAKQLAQLKEDVVFLHSKVKDKTFHQRIIIATTILDEGIDLPEREVIIMAAGGKSSIKVTQRIGRVLRTHPNKKEALIIDFIDRAQWLFPHFKRRKDIYSGFEFMEVNAQQTLGDDSEWMTI